jgi:uncharacterized protein YndB with AHSA1/START domain
MSTATMEQAVQTFEFEKEDYIEAAPETVFESMLDELGPQSQMPDGKPMPLKLEAWPGGRWYRDLGNNAGHLWAHVQVIKPPTLLELYGPMPMPYPAINHIQYRLTPDGRGTKLKLTHKAMGMLTPEHRDGMPQGWEFWLKRIRENAERAKNEARKVK